MNYIFQLKYYLLTSYLKIPKLSSCFFKDELLQVNSRTLFLFVTTLGSIIVDGLRTTLNQLLLHLALRIRLLDLSLLLNRHFDNTWLIIDSSGKADQYRAIDL